MVARRSYSGGAKAAVLTAPISAISSVLVCDALLGWPTGGLGNFAAIIGRGLANEEKLLCSATSGGNLTVVARGYDGTIAQAHGATEVVEHIFTATDADEANAHTSALSGHGIPPGDRLVGETATQTLSGKTMDGGVNTFVDLPLSASPETLARIVDIEAVDVAQSVAIDALPTLAEVNALIAPGVAASAAADALRYTKVESDALYEPINTMYTKAEADALIAAAVAGLTPTDTGFVTSTTGFTAASGFTLSSVRYRRIDWGTYSVIELHVALSRSGADIANNATGNIANVQLLSAMPSAVWPLFITGAAGPGFSTGRIVSVAVQADGTVDLQALGGTSDLGTGEVVSFHAVYMGS